MCTTQLLYNEYKEMNILGKGFLRQQVLCPFNNVGLILDWKHFDIHHKEHFTTSMKVES